MNKDMLRTAVALVTALLMIGGVANATSSTKKQRAEKMRLLDVAETFEFVDVGKPAESEGDFSSGDLLIFENTLRDRADTETLGRFVAICTMAASPGIARCSGTLWLDDGKIELSTAVDFADADRIVSAVTGGTGAYRGARGQAVFGRQVSEAARALTVVLTP
jgi:hypothetical protein